MLREESLTALRCDIFLSGGPRVCRMATRFVMHLRMRCASVIKQAYLDATQEDVTLIKTLWDCRAGYSNAFVESIQKGLRVPFDLQLPCT